MLVPEVPVTHQLLRWCRLRRWESCCQPQTAWKMRPRYKNRRVCHGTWQGRCSTVMSAPHLICSAAHGCHHAASYHASNQFVLILSPQPDWDALATFGLLIQDFKAACYGHGWDEAQAAVQVKSGAIKRKEAPGVSKGWVGAIEAMLLYAARCTTCSRCQFHSRGLLAFMY